MNDNEPVAIVEPEDPAKDPKLRSKLARILADNVRTRDHEGMQGRIDQAYNTYNVNYYKDSLAPDHVNVDPERIQVPLLVGWAATQIAAVLYGRVTPMLTKSTEVTVPPEAAKSVAYILDTWVNSIDISGQARRACELGLIEGESAFLLHIDDDIPSPQRSILLDVVTRRRMLLNRLTENKSCPYLGYLRDEDVDEDDGSGDGPMGGLTGITEPTTANEAGNNDSRVPKTKTYATIFDFKGKVTVPVPKERKDAESPIEDAVEVLGDEAGEAATPVPDGEVQAADPGMEPPPLPPGPAGDQFVEQTGRMVVFCVKGGKVETVDEVGPIPYTDGDGRPVAPLVPLLLTPDIRYPWMGRPSSFTAMESIKPINLSRTWLLRFSRIMMAMKKLADKGRLDADAMAKLNSGTLDETVAYDPPPPGSAAPQDPVKYLETPQIPQAIAVLFELLESDRNATAGSSPLARGEQLDYASATEAKLSGSYSEAALAPLREKSNAALVKLMQTYLCVLAARCRTMGVAAIRIEMPSQEIIDVPIEWLVHPWSIVLKDGPVTPMADAARKLALQECTPILIELTQLMSGARLQGDFDALAALRTLWEYTVDVFGLPPEFRLDTLGAEAKALMPQAPPGALAMAGTGAAPANQPGPQMPAAIAQRQAFNPQ